MNQSLFAVAESPETAVEVNLASGYRQFVTATSSLPVTKDLLAEIQTPQDVDCVILRCKQLAEAPSDPQYENPSDVALSLYLWAIWQKSPSVAQGVAEVVLKCERCWWAHKLALQILDAPKSDTHSPAAGSGAPASASGAEISMSTAK
jgi:hypothetical protein